MGRQPPAGDPLRGQSVKTLLRLLAHLVAEVPPLLVAGLQLAHGWVPTSDDAVIAWRSWDVLSGPVPLDGQFTQISTASGHAAFDLGPLQYFLLALPERVDPLHGVLWGAALFSVVLAALAIEAARAAGGPVAMVATSLGLAGFFATVPEAAVNLAWNPTLGLYALAAALVSAMAVGTGRLGWLPVAVITASLAAQCHVAYAAPALAALVVGLVVGLSWRSPGQRLLRPLLFAGLVGAACWVAPAVQQLTGRPGNGSVLASSLGRHGRTMGIDFGLKAVGSATVPPPSWSARTPAIGPHLLHALYGRPALAGALALGLCAAISLLALFTRRRGLGVLAAVGALSGLATAWTLGSVPLAEAGYLQYYLYFVLWPVGMVAVASVLAAIGALGAAAVRGRTGRPELPARPALAASALGSVALLGAGTLLTISEVAFGSSGLFLLGWQPVHFVAGAVPRAAALARTHSDGGAGAAPVALVVTGELGFIDDAISQGIGYQLATAGVPIRLSPSAARPLGDGLRARVGQPAIIVRIATGGARPSETVSWGRWTTADART